MESQSASPNGTISTKKEDVNLPERKEISTELKSDQKVEATKTAVKKQLNFFNASERMLFSAPVNGDINCEEFFAAGQDYVKFFNTFGFLFKFVISEALKHLKVMREFYEKNKEERKTIGSLLASEKKEAESNVGLQLLWFKRGLEFYSAFLKDLYDNACLPPDQRKESCDIAPQSYGRTLRNHHGFISKKAIMLALPTLPYRATAVKQLCYDAADADELALFTDAMAHIRHLPQVIQVIDDIYVRLQLDTSSTA